MELIFGGILIAVVSGVIGRGIGSYNSVDCETCEERRESCQRLIAERLHNIDGKIDSLTKAVNGKLLVL